MGGRPDNGTFFGWTDAWPVPARGIPGARRGLFLRRLRDLPDCGRLCYNLCYQKIREEHRTMTYDFRPQGVCSQSMRVELDEDHVIRHVEVLGGCSGNLQGISALVEGMTAEEAIRRLKGIRCGFKDSSCPDQLARGLEKALQQSVQAH